MPAGDVITWRGGRDSAARARGRNQGGAMTKNRLSADCIGCRARRGPGGSGGRAAARQHLHRAHGQHRRAADSRIREGDRHQGRRREGGLGRHHQPRARGIRQSEGRRDLEHRRRAARGQHRPAGGVPAQGIRDDRGRVQDDRAVASVHRDPERLRGQHEEAEARGVSEDLDGPGPAPVQEPGVDGGCRKVGLGLHAAQHVPDDLQRQAGRLGQVQGACSRT